MEHYVRAESASGITRLYQMCDTVMQFSNVLYSVLCVDRPGNRLDDALSNGVANSFKLAACTSLLRTLDVFGDNLMKDAVGGLESPAFALMTTATTAAAAVIQSIYSSQSALVVVFGTKRFL